MMAELFQEYEPFGSLLPGRNYSSSSYRFGFQGQIKDDEVYGATGTSYAFEYRMHDARVGRFLSIDPLASKYPWNSPYAFAENDVIRYIDLEGLEKASREFKSRPVLIPPVPNLEVAKDVLSPFGKIGLVTSLREYGENLEQHGSNVQMASLPLVLANPVLAETVANAGQTASLIGTVFQIGADVKDENYTAASARAVFAVTSYVLGSVSKKGIQGAGLPEPQTTFLNISNDILLGKAEEAGMSAVGESGTATESTTISNHSSSSSTTPAASSLVAPTRSTGTDLIAP